MTHPAITNLIAAEKLPQNYARIVQEYWLPLANRIARQAASRKPLIVGINGGQGSGKSTLCRFLEVLLAQRGVRAVTLSLDDLYLTHDERARLASNVHPLFATRGVPGTHGVGMGLAIVEDLLAGRSFTLPRFDKARDDRSADGEVISGPVDVLLFEGWCVGAKPQTPEELTSAINDLERKEDHGGIWRGLVNRFLEGDYADLFGLVDLLVMLKVDSFDAVIANRQHQEDRLRLADPDAPALMNAAEIARFCAHYERLTRHMFAEMPGRADIVFEIGQNQSPIALPDGLSPASILP